MKTIIAATDLSPASINAVNYAVDMACMIDAHVTLFHVYSLPLPVDGLPNLAICSHIEKSIAGQLNNLKEKLADRIGKRVLIHTEIKEGNNLLYELNFLCARIKPYAVVMGPESRSTLEQVIEGGKTAGAIDQLQWPLVIVPSCAAFKNIHKIGLACDFRDVAATIRIKEIKDLLYAFNAELHVLHVTDDPDGAFRAGTVEQSARLDELLQGAKPVYHFITGTGIEKAITDFAESHNLDLLIIIPKKHSLLHRLFWHSHSKGLALHSHRPVMTLHEPYHHSLK